MLRRKVLGILTVCALASVGSEISYAVDANPLQNAYWRLEEGVAGGFVPAPAPGNEGPGVVRDSVLDSVLAGKTDHENHMQAYNSDTAPKYVNHDLPPTYLRSGLRNNLAFEVDGTAEGGRDVYTHDSEIQNGVFDATTASHPGVPAVTGFTLEAAFSVYDYSSFRGIVAKEGRPGLEMQTGDEVFQALPTAALKVRGSQGEGDPDAGKLQFEMFDGAGNLVSVTSDAAVSVGQWYYAAVVNDGDTVSLYLDSNDGSGYQLESQADVDGVLFQGLNYAAPEWNYNWTIGRSTYGGFEDDGITPFVWGRPSDWFNGLIDEVRLTNSALTPDQFLFTQTRIGDLNADGSIDGGDFLAWQAGYDAEFDAQDYADWVAAFGGSTPIAGAAAGVVPEPATLTLVGLAAGLGLAARKRSSRS